MSRNQIIERLLEELKKLPNSVMCQISTKRKVKEMLEKVHFDPIIKKYVESHSLNIRVNEVPKELRTQLILWLVLTTEWWEDDVPIYRPDDHFLDFEDKETINEICHLKRNLRYHDQITLLGLNVFLNYVRLGKI